MYHLPFDVDETPLDDAVSALHEALGLGIKPLLETVEDMLAACGDPDLCFDCVQVAGTNGKTSTARFAASGLSVVKTILFSLNTLPNSSIPYSSALSDSASAH